MNRRQARCHAYQIAAALIDQHLGSAGSDFWARGQVHTEQLYTDVEQDKIDRELEQIRDALQLRSSRLDEE